MCVWTDDDRGGIESSDGVVKSVKCKMKSYVTFHI